MNTDYYTSGITMMSSMFSLISNVVSIVMAILRIVALWQIFAKAGEEGWKSLIPFTITILCVR